MWLLKNDISFQDFIRHILNYTEYNQQWNVIQVRLMDSVIICNTTQENVHKYRSKIKNNKMCNNIK